MEDAMKKGLAIVPLVLATSGCTFLNYPGHGFPRIGRPPHLAVAPPPAPGRWDVVMRLPRGATIDVLARDGTATVGGFARATSDAVTVLVTGQDLLIAKAAIVRIDLVDLPGSEAAALAGRAARGALLGAGAAALVSAVIAGPAWPPPGVLLRGGAAGGAASALQATLDERRGRIIYLAPTQAGGVAPHLPPY
jgi:hypothetical protein